MVPIAESRSITQFLCPKLTENLVAGRGLKNLRFLPRSESVPWTSREQMRHQTTMNDRDKVNISSAASCRLGRKGGKTDEQLSPLQNNRQAKPADFPQSRIAN